jgi:tetratricopeptide (TPR) repeat protein
MGTGLNTVGQRGKIMSSLSTKTSKGRSPASRKIRATKAKKAASKKPQRPGKIVAAPKAKKVSATRAVKASGKVKKSNGLKSLVAASTESKRSTQLAARKNSGRAADKGLVRKKLESSRRIPAKPAPQPPKKPPTANAIAAVKGFEQGLRLFNRHDFAGAKPLFENILDQFSEQYEVVARSRTYLSICEQRMARAPSIPKNPDALYNQGVFELNRGNVKAAIELFEKVVRAESRADHALYSLAAAYARLNDTSKALDALRRAIAIKPVHRPHARRDLDFASLRQNDEFQQLTGFGFDYVEE